MTKTTVRSGEWTAVWHGGAYIDVFHASHPDYALDCINVWDYATGEPTIERGDRTAVRRLLREWVASDSSDDAIRHQLPYIT